MFFGVGECPALRLMLVFEKDGWAEVRKNAVGECPALRLILHLKSATEKNAFFAEFSVICRRNVDFGGHFSESTRKNLESTGEVPPK